MIVWSVCRNQPGYLPEVKPEAFVDRAEAMGFLVEELRAVEFGEGNPEEWAEAYEQKAEDVELSFGGDTAGGDWFWSAPDGYVWSVEAVDLPAEDVRGILGA